MFDKVYLNARVRISLRRGEPRGAGAVGNDPRPTGFIKNEPLGEGFIFAAGK